MDTKKIIITLVTMLVLAAATFSIGAFAVPGQAHAGDRTVQLFGAGCPKAFTDFTNQKWCLYDVSPDNGEINTCSYNNC